MNKISIMTRIAICMLFIITISCVSVAINSDSAPAMHNSNGSLSIENSVEITKPEEEIQLDKIELKERNEKPVYLVKTIKKARLFFLIPISMKIETQVNAQTGDVISVQKPWWSFFVWY